jgi:hypothetical protein
MNTIEHGGKTYEVLTLDRISEITHAKLAGGKVVGTKQIDYTAIRCESPFGKHLAHTDFLFEELEPYGIQPLRLVPKEPVTFEGISYTGVGNPYILAPAGTPHGKRFRCVEIVEEARAILKAKGADRG